MPVPTQPLREETRDCTSQATIRPNRRSEIVKRGVHAFTSGRCTLAPSPTPTATASAALRERADDERAHMQRVFQSLWYAIGR